MELNNSGDYGALVAIVPIDKLVIDTDAALPQRFPERENLSTGIQVLLRHPTIQRELAPNGTVQR